MLQPNASGGYMLVEFDVSADLDIDAWPSPEEILNRLRLDFASLDRALLHLHAARFDTNRFDAPWKMDYPL
jgi:hypothetical protein